MANYPAMSYNVTGQGGGDVRAEGTRGGTGKRGEKRRMWRKKE